jgi:tetratricopeptide (TPR) repeat protein
VSRGKRLPAALEERRRIALRDLEELAEQVENGELDEETAARLRAGYEAELAAVDEAAVGEPAAAESAEPATEPAAEPAEERSSNRIVVGALALIGVLTVIILLAAQVFRSDDSEPSPQTPSDVAALDGATAEDMEALVAAHPESVGMRLALADLYFERGDYGDAIDHYLQVTNGELSIEDESRTIGRIGWMAYSTGQIESAVQFINNSLEINPDYHEGKLFLGMVSLYGLEDPAAAIPLLEEVNALPGLGDQLKAEVEAALADARAGVGSQ